MGILNLIRGEVKGKEMFKEVVVRDPEKGPMKYKTLSERRQKGSSSNI